MEKHQRCPNCGRSLTDNELYCYFCEIDIPELRKADKKQKSNSTDKFNKK